jgi:hypothetical protein
MARAELPTLLTAGFALATPPRSSGTDATAGTAARNFLRVILEKSSFTTSSSQGED